MSETRPVKLAEMLDRLIEQQGYSGARKIVCREVGITPSALAQYMRPAPTPEEKANGARTVRPSFDVLIALADFFGVSLNYLVFGEQPGEVQPLDYGPLGRYIDKTLFDAQMRNEARVVTVARITQRLAEQIDEAAQEILAVNAATGAELLTCDEGLITETCSRECWIITMDMHNDLVEAEGSGGTEAVPGRFFQVVARNVSRGRKYRFLLPYGAQDWTPLVSAYYRLLQRQCGSEQIVLNNVMFRQTRSPLMTGCSLLTLDTAEMQDTAPILYERIRSGLDAEGRLGLILPPSDICQHSSIMNAHHLANGLANFRLLWDNAEPIRHFNSPTPAEPATKVRRRKVG